mgnify:CR=1 FL=1
MKRIRLGASDLESSRLVYGCMRIAGDGSAAARERGRAALRAALEAGFNHFDHADLYGGGACEALFGEWLREEPGLRDDLIITSKCGIRLPDDPEAGDPKRYDFSFEHIVRSGESFWTISRRYGVTHRSLAKWNGMAPGDPLTVGRKLVVWTNERVADAGPATSPVQTGKTTRKLRYTVRNGDSLYLIARKFRVGIDQIARWNNIDKSKILRPGQKLTMYVDVTAQSS